MLVSGKFPSYGLLSVIIFATYVVGDLIAIPFSYVFAKQTDQQVAYAIQSVLSQNEY